jgi:clan AA aspartic protease (TIGR02281 family)
MHKPLLLCAALACAPLLSGLPRAAAAESGPPIARIVADVMINGRGPFHFMLDTGASRAVLSESAARRLGLHPDGAARVEVQGISGREPAAEVHIDRLDTGALHFRDLEVPVLSGPIFEDVDGILGVDGFDGMKLTVSFVDHRCVISASTPRWVRQPRDGAVRVRSSRRPMFTAMLAGVRVEAIVDTGATYTLGNPALLAALRRAGAVQSLRPAPPIIDANQRQQDGLVASTPPLRFGQISMQPLDVTFADYDIFRSWGLRRRPALLLGMDALGTLAQFSIDYGRLEMRVVARTAAPALLSAVSRSAAGPEHVRSLDRDQGRDRAGIPTLAVAIGGAGGVAGLPAWGN